MQTIIPLLKWKELLICGVGYYLKGTTFVIWVTLIPSLKLFLQLLKCKIRNT